MINCQTQQVSHFWPNNRTCFKDLKLNEDKLLRDGCAPFFLPMLTHGWQSHSYPNKAPSARMATGRLAPESSAKLDLVYSKFFLVSWLGQHPEVTPQAVSFCFWQSPPQTIFFGIFLDVMVFGGRCPLRGQWSALFSQKITGLLHWLIDRPRHGSLSQTPTLGSSCPSAPVQTGPSRH